RAGCSPCGSSWGCAVHDEHRPLTGLEEDAEARGEAGEVTQAHDQHLRRRLGKAPRQLGGDVPEAQLGAHLESVGELRLRARIEQLPEAMALLAGAQRHGLRELLDARSEAQL